MDNREATNNENLQALATEGVAKHGANLSVSGYDAPERDPRLYDGESAFTLFDISEDESAAKMDYLRHGFKQLEDRIYNAVPGSAERTLAIRSLEVAQFWLNKALAYDEHKRHKQAMADGTEENPASVEIG